MCIVNLFSVCLSSSQSAYPQKNFRDKTATNRDDLGLQFPTRRTRFIQLSITALFQNVMIQIASPSMKILDVLQGTLHSKAHSEAHFRLLFKPVVLFVTLLLSLRLMNNHQLHDKNDRESILIFKSMLSIAVSLLSIDRRIAWLSPPRQDRL